MLKLGEQTSGPKVYAGYTAHFKSDFSLIIHRENTLGDHVRSPIKWLCWLIYWLHPNPLKSKFLPHNKSVKGILFQCLKWIPCEFAFHIEDFF